MTFKFSGPVSILPENDTDCPYLEGRTFTVSHFLYQEYTPAELEALLDSGYRHFTYYFFRPDCKACSACVPIRIKADEFTPSASHRRILKKNSDLKIVENAGPDDEHFRLYAQHKERFENSDPSDPEDFRGSFFSANANTRALDFYLGSKLICCAHYDRTDQALSAVYTYYDTDYTSRSPGSLAILTLLEYAKKENLRYLYLGYYIAGNRHMNYKIKWYPNQTAVRPGRWVDYTDGKGVLRSDVKPEFKLQDDQDG